MHPVAFVKACQSWGKADMVEDALAKQKVDDHTAQVGLKLAIEKGCYPTIKILLDYGVSPNGIAGLDLSHINTPIIRLLILGGFDLTSEILDEYTSAFMTVGLELDEQERSSHLLGIVYLAVSLVGMGEYDAVEEILNKFEHYSHKLNQLGNHGTQLLEVLKITESNPLIQQAFEDLAKSSIKSANSNLGMGF